MRLGGLFLSAGCATLLWLNGCISVVTKSELADLQRQRLGQTFPPEWYYRGSDAKYDHFAEHFPIAFSESRTKFYRVRREESAISDRFPLTRESDDWSRLDYYDPPDPNHIDFWEPIPLDDLPDIGGDESRR